MEQIDRREARTNELRLYFTGEPCKKGHVCERRVDNASCVECLREKDRRYRLKHLEKRTKAVQRWKQQNRARANEINRLSYHRVGRTKAEYYKEWRKLNPDLYKAIVRRRRAARYNAKGRHTASDIKVLVEKQQGRCLCGISLALGYHVDHKTPLSRGGSNWPSNLQLLCPPCNDSKGARTMKEWKK